MARNRTTNLVTRLLVRQEEFNRKLGAAEKRMGSFNRKMTGFGKNFQRTLAVTFGATALLNFSRNTINLIKRIDSLNKSLRAITGTTEEYAKAKAFLTEISEENGAEILSLQKSYVKFTAAAKGTKLEGEKANTVFKKITKSASLLGLSTADTEGILFALNQMISKGTVSSEELKRQLGDRLPGAFRIMAQAINVSQAELLKLLKTGALLTEDVLPRFADEVEKAYGAKQVKRIDTITASQNRLSNAWTQFVEDVDNGEGVISGAYKGILNSLAQLLGGQNVHDVSNIQKGFRVTKFGFIVKKEDLIDPELFDVPEDFAFEWAQSMEKVKQSAEDAASKALKAYIKFTETAEFKLKKFLKSIHDFEEGSIDFLGRFKQTSPDQAFDDEVAALMGFPPEEAVEEYFENIRVIAETGWASINETWENGTKTMEGITVNMSQVLEDSILVFSKTISSGGNIQDAFQAFMSMLADNMQKIGAAMIVWGIALKALEASFANPAAAITAGIALLAAGTALGAAVTEARRDLGGSNGGTRGPAGSFSNRSTGQTLKIQVEGKIKGRDIVLTYDENKRVDGRQAG